MKFSCLIAILCSFQLTDLMGLRLNWGGERLWAQALIAPKGARRLSDLARKGNAKSPPDQDQQGMRGKERMASLLKGRDMPIRGRTLVHLPQVLAYPWQEYERISKEPSWQGELLEKRGKLAFVEHPQDWEHAPFDNFPSTDRLKKVYLAAFDTQNSVLVAVDRVLSVRTSRAEDFLTVEKMSGAKLLRSFPELKLAYLQIPTEKNVFDFYEKVKSLPHVKRIEFVILLDSKVPHTQSKVK